MFKPQFSAPGIALVLCTVLPAHAADETTNTEIQQLKDRITALENAPPPPPPPANGNAFNPKISLILDGAYSGYSAKTAPVIPGFLLGDGAAPRDEGMSIGETELAVEANVDQTFHGWTTLAVQPQGGIEVEEAYVNTLSLPAGFAVKFGRFFSDIGYQNHQHAHAWEFVDAPLAYRAMLGGQLRDDGIQLRWVAPTDLLLELGAEAYRGDGFPSGGSDRSGIPSYTGFVHLGGDAGDSGSWRVGLSHLKSDADGRETEDGSSVTSFSGNSQLSIVDAVYKWAPNGNASEVNFVGQAEYFYRKEHGGVTNTADSSNYSGTQQGYYVQGVYQFMPRWRAGLRYDHLSSDNQLDTPGANAALLQLADNSHDPRKTSVMVDFSNSEFSRLRLQYSRDESRPNNEADNQVFLQYIFSLGSHPAHQF